MHAHARTRRSSPCTRAASTWRPRSAERSTKARRSVRAPSGSTRTSTSLPRRTARRATTTGRASTSRFAPSCRSNRAAMGSLVPRSSPSSSRRRPDRKPDESQLWRGPRSRPRRAEIFSEVKDGLWLTNTWYTRYQSYVTGDLSTIPQDGIFHIRNGDVVEAWKDIRVTDNLLHLMKNIVALSDEAEQMMWWGEVSVPNFVPYALIKDVGITTSNQ